MADESLFTLNPYTLPILVAALISFSLAFFVWQKQVNRVTNQTFIVVMVALGSWAFFQAVEMSLRTLEARLWLVVPQYLAVFVAVTAWFLFALAYAGYERLVRRRTVALLAVAPTFFFLLVLTNSTHLLMWRTASLDEALPYAILSFAFGPVFWLHMLYSYSLMLCSALLILQSVVYSSGFHRHQSILLLFALFIPWMGNALYLLGLVSFDLAPLGFIITGLIVGWGFLNLRLLDIVPLARTAVFESITDPIFIIDEQERLIDCNPIGATLLPNSLPAAIGQPLSTLLPGLAEALKWPTTPQSEAQTEVRLESAGRSAVYDLHLSPIYSRRYQPVGRTAVLRDVTTRRLAEQSEREQRILAEALHDVAVILNNTLDLDELLRRILTEIERVVPHDTANIMLLQDGMAKVVGYRGFSAEELAQAPQSWVVEKTPNLRAMVNTHQPIIVADTRKDENWIHAPATAWIRSYLGAPILREGRVLGFINIDGATPNYFRPEDADRLQAFANQAAIALWNARLFAELTARNQELDAYAHTIAHDLQSPLNLIDGYAEMIAEYELPPLGRAHLDMIQVTIERMGWLIEQLLLLAQLRDASETAVPLDPRPILYAAIARFTPKIEARGLLFWIEPELLPVMGHAPWLEEVFANLISNAIKYIGSDNQEPVIRIRSWQSDNLIRYEIIDNGLGIAPDHQEKIFELFTRFYQEEAAGTGMGLAIVQRIISKLGGQVGVESAPGRGSTFWFTLPSPDS